MTTTHKHPFKKGDKVLLIHGEDFPSSPSSLLWRKVGKSAVLEHPPRARGTLAVLARIAVANEQDFFYWPVDCLLPVDCPEAVQYLIQYELCK